MYLGFHILSLYDLLYIMFFLPHMTYFWLVGSCLALYMISWPRCEARLVTCNIAESELSRNLSIYSFVLLSGTRLDIELCDEYLSRRVWFVRSCMVVCVSADLGGDITADWNRIWRWTATGRLREIVVSFIHDIRPAANALYVYIGLNSR